jgi:hypothetical protein
MTHEIIKNARKKEDFKSPEHLTVMQYAMIHVIWLKNILPTNIFSTHTLSKATFRPIEVIDRPEIVSAKRRLGKLFFT